MVKDKESRRPRFLARKGDTLKVADSAGKKHTAQVVALDDDLTKEHGSFAFGYCKSCDWTGRARRSRDKARDDARDHHKLCDGKGKVVLGVTDHR
ncbi:hypothetical protein [Flexivirga meconopsidis]|uniref:hypothetical protein n=1 Tax=Flexivirga meconopsidis TaxID=2977121 RepID=UPI00223E9698|nr:hypothetical protein [Flexivirga meconopsidis]